MNLVLVLTCGLLAANGPTPTGVATTPGSGVIVVGAKRGLFAFDRRGGLAWRFVLPDGVTVIGDLAVAPDSTVFARTATEVFAVTNLGMLKWRRPCPAADLPDAWLDPVPMTNSGVLLASSMSEVLALSAEGEVAWRYRVPGGTALANKPVVAADGVIYLPISDQILAITPEGQLMWRAETAQ